MDVLDILKKIVSFDTSSQDKENREILEYIKKLASDLGGKSYLLGDDNRKTKSIIIEFGPTDKPGIILSGHLDVVPAGDGWNSNPFSLKLKDNKAYGRGACDMKGFIACVLCAISQVDLKNLKVPIYLAFSCDEETECRSIKDVIDFFRNRNKPSVCIIGEPTNMIINDNNKGITEFETNFIGIPSHASNPLGGVNAIYAASEFCSFIKGLTKEDTITNVGLIKGGSQSNIIAEECKVIWENRYKNQKNKEYLLSEISKEEEKIRTSYKGLRVNTIGRFSMPAFEARVDNKAKDLCLSLGAKEGKDFPACSEAGFYQNIAIDTVICGPGLIEQAHKNDEFVSVEQLEKCVDFLIALLTQSCAS